MIYYFVSWDGTLTSEDNARLWHKTDCDDIFTNRKKAIAQAKRRTKERIEELKQYRKELECYKHTE